MWSEPWWAGACCGFCASIRCRLTRMRQSARCCAVALGAGVPEVSRGLLPITQACPDRTLVCGGAAADALAACYALGDQAQCGPTSASHQIEVAY